MYKRKKFIEAVRELSGITKEILGKVLLDKKVFSCYSRRADGRDDQRLSGASF